VRQIIRKREKETESHIIDRNNLGTFYRYVNNRISYRNNIGPLIDDDGNVLTDNDQKADLFKEYLPRLALWTMVLCQTMTFMNCLIARIML